MPPPESEICKNCVYYKLVTVTPLTPTHGYCHYLPPTFAAAGPGAPGSFVIVSEDDYCSNYKKAT